MTSINKKNMKLAQRVAALRLTCEKALKKYPGSYIQVRRDVVRYTADISIVVLCRGPEPTRGRRKRGGGPVKGSQYLCTVCLSTLNAYEKELRGVVMEDRGPERVIRVRRLDDKERRRKVVERNEKGRREGWVKVEKYMGLYGGVCGRNK